MDSPDFRQLARKLTQRDFIDKHGHGFLVLNAPEADEDVNAFATKTWPAAVGEFQSGEIVALPLLKSADNPFQAHLSLGRARNCDLVIRHASVSKLHARFRQEPSELLLADAGSQNGTFVNRTRLTPNEFLAVKSSDQLVFGSVPGRILDAAELYELYTQVKF